MTCPLCDGDGEVEGQRYDAKETVAATVVAYGVGEGLRRAEEWVENAPADMRALLAEVERLTSERDASHRTGMDRMQQAIIDLLQAHNAPAEFIARIVEMEYP
jgi:ethanolamine ammonia-lyase small subunit